MSSARTYHTLEQGATLLEQLIGQRNLRPALALATDLVQRFPERAEAHKLLSLVLSLRSREGALRRSEQCLANAQRCSDYTAELGGDMLRDQAIGIIRFSRGNPDDLEVAARIIGYARRLHADDTNRMACLLDVEGRLAYAQSAFWNAERLHREADVMWREMRDGANPVWIYNNLIHWLKALVAVGGSRSDLGNQLSRRIRENRPPGAPNRFREAVVIRVPGVGRGIHDFLIRHR